MSAFNSGIIRRDACTKWSLPEATCMHQIALMDGEVPIDLYGLLIYKAINPVPSAGMPVFVGHYWMKGKPRVLTPKVASVNYSAGHRGSLVAYRRNGENELHDGGFVSSH